MLSFDNTLTSDAATFISSSDFELNGEINRASQQGAKFALLVAMLEPNALHRPRFGESEPSEYYQGKNPELYHYRRSSLMAKSEYWQGADNPAKLIRSGHIASAQLWLAMHPEPLSLHNDAAHIDEDIMNNATVFAQSRLKKEALADIQVDETGLFDILDELKATQA